MANLLKPDKILADLEVQLASAKSAEERQQIQEKISQRQQEVFRASGFTNVGFGSGGYFLPGGGQGVGSEVLEPTGVPGVFQKSVITADTSVDPYGRKSIGVEGSKRTFFDALGNPISPQEIAKTSIGQSFAAAGWDIGFGAGVIPDQVSAVSDQVSAVKPTNVSPTSIAVTPTSAVTPSGVSVDPSKMARQSAYDFLREQFEQYGLGSLVQEIQGLVESNVNPSEFAIRLRQTPTYKRRFAANDARIKNGLRALSEGEYIALEDQYQNILRNYGLPATYYSRDDIGRQEGFERFISGDVSPAELEDRIQLGINRVRNAAPEVEQTLRQFYPGITQSDILAYTLDPDKALTEIQRKVQAAEIGAEARRAGLTTMATRAEELQRYGVTKEAAQQGFQTIAEVLPRGSQLAEIYKQSPYTQQVAEQEVFALPGAAAASRQRRRLTELEQASFAGQAGTTGGALGRERAGQF